MGGMLLLVVFFVIVGTALRTVVGLGLVGAFWLHDFDRWCDSITNQWRWWCKVTSFLRSRWWLNRLGDSIAVSVILTVAAAWIWLENHPEAIKNDRLVAGGILGSFVLIVLIWLASCLIDVEGVAERK